MYTLDGELDFGFLVDEVLRGALAVPNGHNSSGAILFLE